MPFGLIDPEGLAAVRSAEQRDVALMVRGIFAAGLLSERLSADQLRARTAKHEWIADLHRLARQHHTNALQLAAWYVRHRAPRAVWVVGCTSEHQLRLNVTMFSSPLPDPSLFDHCDALAAHHMPLVAGRP
jgi:aryl-alcohol dehydrogenase-like predicted oxidoreductase